METVLGFTSIFKSFLLYTFNNWQQIKLLKKENDVTRLSSFKYKLCFHILSKLQRSRRALMKARKIQFALRAFLNMLNVAEHGSTR